MATIEAERKRKAALDAADAERKRKQAEAAAALLIKNDDIPSINPKVPSSPWKF
jgi:hypothetical protein